MLKHGRLLLMDEIGGWQLLLQQHCGRECQWRERKHGQRGCSWDWRPPGPRFSIQCFWRWSHLGRFCCQWSCVTERASLPPSPPLLDSDDALTVFDVTDYLVALSVQQGDKQWKRRVWQQGFTEFSCCRGRWWSHTVALQGPGSTGLLFRLQAGDHVMKALTHQSRLELRCSWCTTATFCPIQPRKTAMEDQV